MSLMDLVHSGKKHKPRRTMVYGVRAIGKSTFAHLAPKPVFIQTSEEGLGDIDTDSLPFCNTFDDVMHQIMMVWADEHNYETLVIDTATSLDHLIKKQVAEDKGVGSVGDIGYGKAPAMCMQYWQKFIDGITSIWNGRNMGVIIVAHQATIKVKDPHHDDYDKFTPRLDPLASDALQDWCDEILFMRDEIFVTKKQDGFSQKTTATSADQRIMLCNAKPTHDAKNRLNMPDQLPLRYSAYREYIEAAQNTNVNNESADSAQTPNDKEQSNAS